MPVVTNIARRPDRSPAAGAVVTVRLIASLEGSGPGYVSGATATVLDRWVAKAAADGSWSVDLVPNAEITPAGTVYEVTEAVFGRSPVVQHIIVPTGAGPHWVGAILTEPPASLPSAALSAHLADHADVGGYTHVQDTPSAEWTILHNLGRFPPIAVVDSTQRVVVPGEVIYDSVDQVRVQFGAPFGGRAYL